LQKGFFGISLPEIGWNSFRFNSDGFAKQSSPGFNIQIRLSTSEGIIHEKTGIVSVSLCTNGTGLKLAVAMSDN